MFVIIVYDIGVKRVSRVCNYLRKYLNWVQNSVFEGELTISELKRIEHTLKDLIEMNNDSIIIYSLSSSKALKTKYIGKRKTKLSQVI